jgi:hypothetical protein
LRSKHEGGAGIVEQVRDDRADALAGAGRGAGQDVPVLAEAAIGTSRHVSQVAEGESIIRRCRPLMGRGVLRLAEAGRAVGGEGRGREQGRPDTTQTAGQESGTAR